jgi:hypothetical protein
VTGFQAQAIRCRLQHRRLHQDKDLPIDAWQRDGLFGQKGFQVDVFAESCAGESPYSVSCRSHASSKAGQLLMEGGALTCGGKLQQPLSFVRAFKSGREEHQTTPF